MFYGEKVFTLVELLIVIAIIAILTVMLLPALNKARTTAKAIQCVSNQVQISKALVLYRDDCDDYIPPWIPSGSDYVLENFWAGRLLPYCNNNISPWLCPDSPAVKYRSSALVTGINIGINAASGGSEIAFRNQYFKGITLKRPSMLVYTADGAGRTSSDYTPANTNDYCFLNPANIWPSSLNGLALRHSNAIVLMFIDGHAEKIPETTLRNWNTNIYSTINRPRWFAKY